MGRFSSYEEAERVVDYLSDHGFPVERTAIVGRDLEYVEQVTGRMTYARAALAGALNGAVIGFLIGWLFGASRPTALAVLGTAGLAAVLVILGVVIVGFVVPRRRWGADRDLARWVGSRTARQKLAAGLAYVLPVAARMSRANSLRGRSAASCEAIQR